MRAAPQREQFDPPKARRGFASRAQNAHRTTVRAIRPTQSAQRVHFAFSKRAPRHSESDSTHPKCAEGSLCIFKMCAAPQRKRCDPPSVRRGFTLHFQNMHRATARAIRPTQSAQRLHFALTLHLQNVHRATARAIGPTQSAQRVRFAFSKMHRAKTRASRPTQSAAPATTSARKLESAAPAAKSARKALKCCACHEICTKSSNCSARMISTDVLQICGRENEPIVRQGQRKRRRRKHYHAPAKQHSGKRKKCVTSLHASRSSVARDCSVLVFYQSSQSTPNASCNMYNTAKIWCQCLE